MSIDLSWASLNSSTLSATLLQILNKQLVTTPKPSFIGPVEIISIEFGSNSPDIELVDLRDIYRDFLEDDDEEAGEQREVGEAVAEGPGTGIGDESDADDSFEWVSRRSARRSEILAFQQLGRGGPLNTNMFASTPTLPLHPTSQSPGMMMDTTSLLDYHQHRHYWSNTSPRQPGSRRVPPNIAVPLESIAEPNITNPPPTSDPNLNPNSNTPSPHPNLQLHLHIHWTSDLRITLTTSLLINYPSPMFMSLPIKLSITGLVFDGEIAIAYEGDRRQRGKGKQNPRVHICILDEEDPYGPRTRTRNDSSDSSSTDSTSQPSHRPGLKSNPNTIPIGHRLLPSIFIESEIGQGGDSPSGAIGTGQGNNAQGNGYVLKNVNRVERFIQDVIRNAVEEELVFPNFHTLVLGE